MLRNIGEISQAVVDVIHSYGGAYKIPISFQLCNLCENFSSADWLMYISEWTEESRPCSNCKVSVRAAVHTVLSETAAVQTLGAALVFNLSLKEVTFYYSIITFILDKYMF